MSWETKDNKMIFNVTAIENDVIIPDETLQLRAEFEAACENFRSVCKEIGKLLNNPNFTGGFDEMSEFENSEAAQSNKGIILSVKWMAADKLCTYLASKLRNWTT